MSELPAADKSRWEIQQREVLHKNPWHQYRHDHGMKPNGQPFDYYYLYIPKSVGVVALTKDNKMMLVRQYRYLTERETIEVPGGKADEKESPEEAARRELLEETGYSAEHFEMISELEVMNGYSADLASVFLARGLTKVQEPQLDESEEGMTIEFHPVEDVYQMVWDGKITDSFTLAALMLASHKLL